jgi:zinc protease
MKTTLARLLALALALSPLAGAAQTATAGPPTAGPPTATSQSTSTRTLANGLKIVVVEDHAAAVVQTAMWYRFGSLDETPGKTGLAHALEHMMFRGTKDLSGGGLTDIGARLGAEVNANTSEDYTHFYFVMPADRLDLAIHIEADRMRGLLLKQSDWDLERGAVLSEIDGDNSQPVGKLLRDVRAAAYRGSPYALTALGERADVVRATAADLRHYYDEWYHPNNATLVVTGDVRPDDVFASAQRWFGSIPAQTVPARRALPAPAAGAAPTLRETADFPYTVVDLAYRIPGDLGTEAPATQLIDDIMSRERSTFYKALVESKLTLGYNAFADTALNAGIFHVVLFLSPGTKPDDARRAFETTLNQMRDGGVDASLLDAAKISVARQAVYARDAISGLGDRYGYALGVTGHDPAVDDARFAAVDAPAIDRALRTYFSAPAAVGILTPRAANARNGSTGPGSVASDNFSQRAPSGPIVLAPWARAGIAKPVTITSRVKPQTFTLSNGLRLYVQPIPANPTVFVDGTIELSPAFDPPGKTGTGALASSLLSYGSEKYDFEAQRRIADELGADLSWGSSFSAHGLSSDLDRMLDVLADGEQHPQFLDRYIELVRSQNRASVAQRDANPDARAEIAFARALYAPGDPTLRQPTVASLDAITRADITAYAAHYFRPDRTTLVVAGAVEPDAVRAAVERAFGGWRNDGPRPEIRLPAIPPTRSSLVAIPAQRDSVSVRMGQAAIARTNPDFYAYNLVNAVLGSGGTFDTRLMHEIRDRRGLVYGVSSALLVTRERGVFEIELSAAPTKVNAAITGAKAEVARVTREPISADEWNRARTKLLASTIVGEESSATIVARCENIAINRLPVDYYATVATRYGNVTPADGLRVAKRYLHPSFAEVVVGPFSRH